MASPIRPTDDDARQMARALLRGAEYAALAFMDAEGAGPTQSRIALAMAPDGAPMSLVSELSAHSSGLALDPRCSLLVGEVAEKGDPLTHPRLTVQAAAIVIRREDAPFAGLRESYLSQRPKSKLYIDFGDFYIIRFDIRAAFLNGGFGKAYHLTPADLAM